MGQAPEDGEDGIQAGQRRCDRGLVHVTPGQGDRQVRANFPGRASRDSVVVQQLRSEVLRSEMPETYSELRRTGVLTR